MHDAVHRQLEAHAGDTTLDDRTLGALAAAAYEQPSAPLPGGWDTMLSRSDTGGYYGVAVFHPASRTMVVANRGTNFTSLADWRQNLRAAVLRRAGAQIPSACQLVRDAAAAAGSGVDRIVFTGHSLGGALAEAQGALALSLLPDRFKAGVRTVGVASPSFGGAVVSYARAEGLPLHPDPASVITHYVRRRDVVPGLDSGRLGRTETLASIYFARQDTGHNDHILSWSPDINLLDNHAVARHVEFWDVPGTRHIWFSYGNRTYDPRDGERPSWTRTFKRPADA